MDNDMKYVAECSKVIKRFCMEWRENPFFWSSEIEIQAELYCRLMSIFKDDEKIVEAHYTGWKLAEGQKRKWQRVCCEWPRYYIDDASKTRKLCRPDIIVWKSEPESLSPMNVKSEEDKGNFPILLAIEIKTDMSNRGLQEKSKGDEDKLTKLISYNDVNYACVINFHFQHGNKDCKELDLLSKEVKVVHVDWGF